MRSCLLHGQRLLVPAQTRQCQHLNYQVGSVGGIDLPNPLQVIQRFFQKTTEVSGRHIFGRISLVESRSRPGEPFAIPGHGGNSPLWCLE